MTLANGDDAAEARINAYLDGELDDSGMASLETWLGAHPDHRAVFLRATTDHRMLHQRLSAPQWRMPPETAGRRVAAWRRAAPRRAARGRVPQALAAVLFLGVALLGLSVLRSGRAETLPVAAVAAAAQPLGPKVTATTASVTLTLRSGQKTAAAMGRVVDHGDLLTVGDDGSVELSYPDQTCVRVHGGSTVSFSQADGAKHLTLLRGRISAEVSPQPVGHPAAIITREAEISVFGTALSVACSDGETSAEVAHGRISMKRLSDRAVVGISAGEYAVAAAGCPLLTHATGTANGTMYAVGPGQTYPSLDSLPGLQPGDLVEIHPGIYHEAKRWRDAGTVLRPIIIRGIGSSRPTLDANGIDIAGAHQRPRAVFQIEASHIVVEHLEFINGRNDANGAGIRVSSNGGGSINDTVVRDCLIHDCDMGVTTDDNDHLLLENCEIGFNGSPSSPGHSHNLSLAGRSSTVRGCWIHDATQGQNVKSQGHYTELLYNLIADSQDGEVGLVDGADTSAADSNAVLIGNVIIAKERGADWYHGRFVFFGSELGQAHLGTLYAFNNTFVTSDTRTCFLQVDSAEAAIVAANNIFVGSDHIVDRAGGMVTGLRNWLPPMSTASGFTDGVLSSMGAPGFVDASKRNFRLAPSSPCVGSATMDALYRDGDGHEHSAIPLAQPTMGVGTTPRRQDPRLDVGAFAASRSSR